MQENYYKKGRIQKWVISKMAHLNNLKDCTGALIRTGQKTFFCKSGRARKFWTALIGRARQKQKSGRATHISGPS